ncbi:MAG: hypothetical protein AABY53_10460 [Bdellovibrionota bacterium]
MKYAPKKTAITLFVFTLIFFGASCLKKQNLEVENLGSPVPPEQIAAALSDGFGVINYSDIKVNEQSSIVLSQTIQDGATQVLEQQDVTIQAVNNNSATLELNVLANTLKYSGGNTTQSTRIWNKVFTKYSGYAFSMNQNADQNAQTNAATDAEEPMYMFQVIQNLALGSCYDDGNYPETCHNLVTSEIDYKVPPGAAHQHACLDIYNCFIKAKKIEFDLIRKYDLESDGKPKRIHYTLILTQQTPFLSKVLRYCTRSLYDIPGVPQKILADLCYNVNNYSFGQ